MGSRRGATKLPKGAVMPNYRERMKGTSPGHARRRLAARRKVCGLYVEGECHTGEAIPVRCCLGNCPFRWVCSSRKVRP